MTRLMVLVLLVVMVAMLAIGTASPASAAALCYDGTYSSSSGSGTCSHHGGVYWWL
jgi:hypothetical protein